MFNQPAADNAIEQEQDSKNLCAEMAEKVVLGGLMRKDNTLDALVVLLTETDFLKPGNRVIFAHIAALRKTSISTDLIAVAKSLERSGELDQVGGLCYLNSLQEDLPCDRDIQQGAIILRERLELRTPPIVRIDEELLLLAGILRQGCRERVRRKNLENLSAKFADRAMNDSTVNSAELINEAVADLFKLLVAV